MNVADVLELYDYDRWANAQVIDVAEALTADERHRALGTSYESVFGTLVHVLWSEWIWLGRWTLTVPTCADPRSVLEFPELRERWAAFEPEQNGFLSTLADHDLNRMISYESQVGTTWSYSLQHMLQHVVNHSTYHRGQLTSLFRQLGHKPRPLDFLVYFDVLNAGA